MICETPRDFAAILPRGRAILGLDLGTKTLGVAISDPLLTVATPMQTIKRHTFTADAACLGGIAAARGIGGMVLGLPLHMHGAEGPRAQSTRAFARNLTRHASFRGMPIVFWDERLSTVAAERALLAAHMTRKRRARVIDHVAAGYILQGMLDRLAHLQGGT
ncbi:MAG: Holliday junction resolvase RuvX [Rhodobacteraceae bacterium]|nr:Holliday junction resolvase RuvX [Paracoccaceae bacterium]